jgi:hypothetical protein
MNRHFETRRSQIIVKPALFISLALLALAAVSWPRPAQSQVYASTPDTQRNAINAVRSQIRALHNATQTARNYGDNGVQVVWQQFAGLRQNYNTFASTLTPNQSSACPNEWAELSAGLDILQQSFDNYRQDLVDGRTTATALSDMCRVLDEGGRVWLAGFDSAVRRSHAGW